MSIDPVGIGAMVSRTVTMNVQVSVFPLGSVAKRFTVFVPIEKKVPELSVAE